MTQHDDAPSWGRSDQTGTVAVWAPSAGLSLLHPDQRDIPMPADPAGWHRAAYAAEPGDRYGLRIADPVADRLVPDPASRSQPDGPGALSQAVADDFTWSDATWQGRPWHETILYELHIGTFTEAGTFAAAAERLDHLDHLGITVIELMPVAEFDGTRGWGYDGVLPYAPFHGYGRPDDLRRFVDAAHARGIAVVLDVVYNHFGPSQNLLPTYAPEFFTDAHKTPWGGAIDFARPAVREFFVQNAVYWIESFHLDGLRLDAVQAIFDDGPRHILDEIATRARAAAPGRHIHLMLENDDNDSRWMAAGYDAQWNDDFHHVMRVLLAGRVDGYYRDYAQAPIDRLGRALAEGFSYQGQDESIHRPGLFRGTQSAHLPPTAFVNFLQNHDQVGNTPFGKRLCALAPAGALRLGAAILLLGPAIPMLFMGEEWAAAEPFDYFCDYGDELAEAVRNGRRDEFAHLPEFSDPAQLAQLADPNAAATRDACVLDWESRTAEPHAAALQFHRDLIALRRERILPLLPAIAGRAGRYERIGQSALAASWRLEDGRTLTLAANFADTATPWSPPPGETLFQLGTAPSGPPSLGPWGFHLALHN